MSINICFLIQTPLTKRDYGRFGVELLKKRGFEVTFLDLTAVLNPDYLANYSELEPSVYKSVVNINVFNALELFLKANKKNAFVIFLIGYQSKAFKRISKILKKYKIYYGILSTNIIPFSEINSNAAGSRVKKLLSVTKGFKDIKDVVSYFKKIIYGISDRLFLNIIYNWPAKFIFTGGEKSYFSSIDHFRNSSKIEIHALDYDLFLEYRQNNPERLIKERYAVFLDEYSPLHPDYLVPGCGKNPYENHIEYYKELREIFNILQNKIGTQIIIAAHPRSQYEKMPDLFNGYRLMKGKTIELVAHADYVMAHASTAINFAVLFKKPVIFLMPRQIENGYYAQYIEIFAKKLHKAPMDIDKIIKKARFEWDMMVDEEAYAIYKNSYIKRAGSPERFSWDIVADAVDNLFH